MFYRFSSFAFFFIRMWGFWGFVAGLPEKFHSVLLLVLLFSGLFGWLGRMAGKWLGLFLQKKSGLLKRFDNVGFSHR